MFKASRRSEADHRVDREPRVAQETGGLPGFCDPACFDDDPLGGRITPGEIGESCVEVVADLATDAAVREFHDVVAIIGFARAEQCGVDVDLPDVVDDDGDAFGRGCEHSVDHGGLSRAEPSTEHSYRNCR